LASYSTLLVGPPPGPLHSGRQPVHQDRLAGAGHLRKPLAKLVEAGDEGAVGLAEAELAKRAQQQVQAVADLVLEMPTMRPARRYDRPSSSTAPTASRRTASGSGRVPPRPGRRGKVGQAIGQPGQRLGGQRRARAV